MAMSNIVVNDGATAPVSHTFTPQQGQVGKSNAVWYERNLLSSQGWPRVESRVDLAARPKDGNHTMRTLLHIPVVVVDASGAEINKGTRSYYVTAVVPYGLNSESGLKADFGLLKNVLGHAELLKVFKDQTPNG